MDDQDPEQLSKTFEAFVRARIPADCSVEVICYKGSRAVALPYDMPQLAAAQAALAAPTLQRGPRGSAPVLHGPARPATQWHKPQSRWEHQQRGGGG